MSAVARPFTAQDHAELSAAIRAAEASTSGEIVCVVARRSADYFFAAATALLGFVLAASLVVALLLEHWWMTLRLPVFVAAELLAGACALLLLKAWPALRLAFTPHGLRFRAAHDNAVKQFLARNVHRTSGRTGVLIFVSLAERYAEVLADSGIDARVPPGTWSGIVTELTAHAGDGRLVEGLTEAITEAGRLLALHFPPPDADKNELSDHLVEL